MKIGIDARTTQGDQGLRGVGKYVFELTEGLSRLAPENEYVLFVFPDLPVPDRLRALPPSWRVVPLPTRRLAGYPWHRRLPFFWKRGYAALCRRQNLRALEQAVKREALDVLHLPCVVDPTFFPEADVDCRLVKTLHDLIPLVMADQDLHTWSPINQWIYRTQIAAFARADVVVAISESTRRDAIHHLGLPSHKVRVVPNAVSEEFAPVTDGARLRACREKHGICHPYFLFCSGDSYNKNRERVIEAFAQFTNKHPEPYQIVFAGPRGPREIEHLAESARRHGLTPNQFRVTGFVPDADLVALYAGADALVMPSLYEGFGLPAAQAMRTGTPVIASDRSSQPEVVGDAGLLVDPYQANAIAEAMLRLAQDPNLRAGLSARGRERAPRFSWQNQAQALLEIYRGEEKP